MFPSKYLRILRERGWTPISAAEYRAAWARWGGSVRTHPDFVQVVSGLAGIPVRYLGWYRGAELQAAIATWGHCIALHQAILRRHGIDLGSAETILPQAPESSIRVAYTLRHLSALHAGRIQGLRRRDKASALARAPEDHSSKFRNTSRRHVRVLCDNGGRVMPASVLTAAELADVYTRLFEKRWGFATPGKQHLVALFSALRPFMTGQFITIHDVPAALQILYRVESPRWISVEFINGGVDPEFRRFSPGSVLHFVNTEAEWAHARSLGKDLRYSFGHYRPGSASDAYKLRWCELSTAYKI